MASESSHGDERNEGTAAAWGEGGDMGPADVSLNSNEHQDEQPSYQIDQSAESAESAEIGDFGSTSPQEYDPAGPPSAALIASPTPPRPNPTQSNPPKPTTIGGFIVGDDSDEEEDGGNAQPTVPSVPVSEPVPIPDPSGSQAVFPGPTDNVTNGVAPAAGTSFPQVNVQQIPDHLSILEKRVKEDPRGDMDAWLALINEYRRRNNIEQIRAVYRRFLDVFPQSATAWASWIETELDQYNFAEAESLFGQCLMTAPHVDLWTVYLNYIRRRNDTTNDPDGNARKVVTQAYEFVLGSVGVDKDAARIWQDYIQFIRSGPGQIGGSNWQDQHKMDQLRKAYQRAIAVPTSAVNTLWKEYDQFEMGLNKITGRKFIQERSPSYMSAKSANIALDNITRRLNRTTYPRLPPAPGFDGDTEFAEQLETWKKWITWEKDDPLVLKDDEPAAFKQRILHCYKQALMAMRFVPELWVDAAEWCFKNNMSGTEDAGMQFLIQGVAANPESVLLALKHADRVEATFAKGDGDDAKQRHADAVREPYNRVLDTLYDMCKDLKEKEKADVALLDQSAPAMARKSSDGDGDEDENEVSASQMAKSERVKAVEQGYAVRSELLSRTISFVWIALARAMRRIQGKGGQGQGGLRQTFLDARRRGRLTSDVYVAVALMESVVYGDAVGAKIFERGMTLFPDDENYMLEYLKYLHYKDDTTNARVVFEKCANRLTSKPETVYRAKPLYSYFHKYESQFGELAQIIKLEDRMAELFPEDPRLLHFTQRYSTDKFDPIMARIIVSQRAQLRPKMVLPSVEQPNSLQNSPVPAAMAVASPRPQFIRATASPKRPFPSDDFDDRPRKLARGESPLKGAAGRRLDQQRRNQAPAINKEITFFLSILPRPELYNGPRINYSKLTSVLPGVHVPDFATWKSTQDQLGRPTSARPSAPPRQAPVEYPSYGQYPGQPRPQSPYGSGPGRLGVAPQGAYPPPRPGSRGYEHQPYQTRSDAPPYGHLPPGSYAPPPHQQQQQQQQQYGRYAPY